MIKEKSFQEYIIILNLYTPSNIALKYTKQKIAKCIKFPNVKS